MSASHLFDRSKPVIVIGGGVAGQRAALDLAQAGIETLLLDKDLSLGGTVAQLGTMFPLHNCLLCRGDAVHGPGCTRPVISSQLLDHSQPDHLKVWTQSQVVSVSGEAPSLTVTIVRQPRYVDLARCINCDRCAQACPQELPDDHQAGLASRKAAYRPAFRAVPNAYAIEKGDYCRDCGECVPVCPTDAIDLAQEPETAVVEASAIVVATGMQLYDAGLSGEYGYGRYANVFTGLEMERMTSPAGPGEGRVVRRSDGQSPKRIAWLQCVGSRDEGHDYCSSFCCGYATRQAVLARQLMPEAQADIYMMDDRVYAQSFSETYDPLRKDYDITLSRNRVSVISQAAETQDLILQITDDAGKVVERRHDMVVLSIGCEAAAQASGLANTLGLNADVHGFMRTGALAPVDSGRQGIFLAGAATGPADVADSVQQGSAAAARVRQYLDYPSLQSRGFTRVEPASTNDSIPTSGPDDSDRRIGVMVCNCAGDIGDTVQLDSVMDYVRTLSGVSVAHVIPFGCLPEGLAEMREMVQTSRLSHLVVGACVERTYRPLFERELGVPIRFISLREECAYVHHDDPEGATRKAMEMLRMAVSRVRTSDSYEPLRIEPTREALVVGGGLAGLTAALHLADGGMPVHLVECQVDLGGNALRLGLGPDGEDIPGHTRGLIQRAGEHSQIQLHLGAQVAALEGGQGRFVARLQSLDGGVETLHVGAVIVATGGQEYRGPVYGLGDSDQVATLLDMGARLGADPDLPGRLNQMVFMSCVGPWDEPESDREWRCSRTCCETMIKHATAVKEANPACQVIVLSREVNAYAFREERYTAARRAGVLFVRYDASSKPIVDLSNGLQVTVRDTSLNEMLVLQPDLLALGAAILPRSTAQDVGERLGIPQIGEGFYQTWESKTRPNASLEPGIYLCGLAQGPKPSRETIPQALAAANQALSYLSQDAIELSGAIAVVDEVSCVACLTCVRTCPYGVPRMTASPSSQGETRTASFIEPSKCQGCGTCVAECPGQAIRLMGCGDEELMGAGRLGQWLVVS